MQTYLLLLAGAAVIYIWIEYDPETGGALLLLLVLAMLAKYKLPNLSAGG